LILYGTIAPCAPTSHLVLSNPSTVGVRWFAENIKKASSREFDKKRQRTAEAMVVLIRARREEEARLA
jgi:hypothetical protein